MRAAEGTETEKSKHSNQNMACEEENAEKLIGQNDLKKLRDLHLTAGVREGIDAGKESALQDGFNCGYKEAFCQSHHYGKLRGVLSAVLSYISSRHKDNKCSEEKCEIVKTLLSKLLDAEAKYIKEMKRNLKDRNITQDKPLCCRCSGGDALACTEQNPKDDIQNTELTELWDKCKHLCSEIGIDFQKLAKLM